MRATEPSTPDATTMGAPEPRALARRGACEVPRPRGGRAFVGALSENSTGTLAGGLPEDCRNSSGMLPELFRNAAGTLPELSRNSSGTLPELFRNSSGGLPELLRRIAGGLPPMPELYRSMFGNNPLAILRLAGRPCSRSLADKHSTSTPADWPRRQFFFDN